MALVLVDQGRRAGIVEVGLAPKPAFVEVVSAKLEAVADLATKMSNEVMEWSDISALLARRVLCWTRSLGLDRLGLGRSAEDLG